MASAARALHRQPGDADEHSDRDHTEHEQRGRCVAACGRRKALTPFAIASTPVSAVEPDEKARNSDERGSDADAARERVRTVACGHEPSAQRARPTPTSAKIDATKP